jgi:hypothetical protein
MRLEFPYLLVDTDRHGNERLYVRRFGRKIRLRVPPADKRAFAEAYGFALEALESGAPRHRVRRAAHQRARWAGWRPPISRRSSS